MGQDRNKCKHRSVLVTFHMLNGACLFLFSYTLCTCNRHYSLSYTVTAEPLARYTGHTALITRIIVMDDLLISASWDRWVGPWYDAIHTYILCTCTRGAFHVECESSGVSHLWHKFVESPMCHILLTSHLSESSSLKLTLILQGFPQNKGQTGCLKIFMSI